jgi:hypothetical protein
VTTAAGGADYELVWLRRLFQSEAATLPVTEPRKDFLVSHPK